MNVSLVRFFLLHGGLDQPAHSRSLIRISLDAFWIAKEGKFPHGDIKESDQAARMHMSENSFSHLSANIQLLFCSILK